MGERFEIPINVRATITIDPRLYIKFPTGAEVLADTLKLCPWSRSGSSASSA
jgi:hypothetical protein